MIEQRPTRREVLPYNEIRPNTKPLCPEFWTQNLSAELIVAGDPLYEPRQSAWSLPRGDALRYLDAVR